MADYINIATFKSKLAPKLHGANLNKIVGSFYDKMREGAAVMLNRIDPPDTVQLSRIDNAIYDRIYNYTCPAYLKGKSKFIDIRPIGPRSIWDEPFGTSNRSFDLKKQFNNFTVEMINGVKTLRINHAFLPPQTVLAELDSINVSTSTTAVASGDASNLLIDTLDYVSDFGSMTFDLSGVTGSGVISFVMPQSLDLSTMLNLGSLFAWLKFSDASRITSVKLRFGSADTTSNYWEQTVTVPQGRSAFDTNGWDLCNFPWLNATKVGSPLSTAIKYLRVEVVYSTGVAVLTNKMDSITASLGVAYEATYYDSRIFKTAATGALKSTPTLDSDLITLDEAALQIYMQEVRRILVQEIKGKSMAGDMADVNYTLEGDGRIIRGTLVANRAGLYRDYTAQNQSEAIAPQEEYYDFDGAINSDDVRRDLP